MKRINRSLVYGVILIFFATLSASADKQLFSLAIDAPTEPLKSGAELRLLVTVKNTSDRTIGFIRSPGLVPEEGFRYQIDARDQQGQPAPPSAYALELKNRRMGTFESRYAHWLKPGESFVDQVTVTKFYDLNQPGKYTISVAREIPPRQNLDKGSVRSNAVTVTVTQ